MPEIKIEDQPELRGFTRNAVEWSFTSAMWGVWIYLFLPLLTLFLWAAGVHYIHYNLFGADALVQLLNMLMRIGWAVLILFALLRGWGFYNYYLFGRKERRKAYPEPGAAEIGRHFGLPEGAVQILQSEKEIVCGPAYEKLCHLPQDLKPQLVRTARASEPVAVAADAAEQGGVLRIELHES